MSHGHGADSGDGWEPDYDHHDHGCGHSHHDGHSCGYPGYYDDPYHYGSEYNTHDPDYGYVDGGSAPAKQAGKSATLVERIKAMTTFEKVSASVGALLAVDGVRRIFSGAKEKKDEPLSQAQVGAVEAVGGSLWVAKVLEDAGKAAARRL